MDRNKIIGYSLMILLVIGFFIYTSYQDKKMIQQKQAKEIATATLQTNVDTLTALPNSPHTPDAKSSTSLPSQQEELITIETNLLKIVFTNKGGSIKHVVLKKYPNLSNGQDSISYNYRPLSYAINQATGNVMSSNCLYRLMSQKTMNDGAIQIIFAYNADNTELHNVYTIYPDNYLIDFTITANTNLSTVLGNEATFNFFVWNKQVETDLKYEIQNSKVGFYSDNKGYDFERATKDMHYSIDYPIQWISYNQRFFNSTLRCKEGDFTKVDFTLEIPADTALHTVGRVAATLHKQVQGNSIALQIFYGPNDYHILKAYQVGMENIVDMGTGVFAFVKYINRWIILPMVDFLMKYIANMGLLIALVTIIIRLITSPLLYSSYLGAAKMKALKPDLEEIKKKTGGDQQKFAMEQMNLFREAGVNPLNGCIPPLLQMPIFIALYSFFLGYIGMRGQSFWWANDLSNYDVIWRFPSLPLIGDHLSLFTLIYVATSFLLTFFGMASTTPTVGSDVNAKMMKYMVYIMPIIFFFVFNSIPAALTWYYAVSNTITIIIQFIIQRWIISPHKVHAKIQENKKRVKKKSVFQLKLEEMQKQQKQAQTIRNQYKKQ